MGRILMLAFWRGRQRKIAGIFRKPLMDEVALRDFRFFWHNLTAYASPRRSVVGFFGKHARNVLILRLSAHVVQRLRRGFR